MRILTNKVLNNKKFKITFIKEHDPLKSNDKRGLTYVYFDKEEEPTLMYQECKVWECDYEQTEIKFNKLPEKWGNE